PFVLHAVHWRARQRGSVRAPRLSAAGAVPGARAALVALRGYQRAASISLLSSAPGEGSGVREGKFGPSPHPAPFARRSDISDLLSSGPVCRPGIWYGQESRLLKDARMIKKILIAYDGSSFARRAFDVAFEMARLHKASMIVLSVAQMPEPALIYETTALLEEAQEHFEKDFVEFRAKARQADVP